MTLGDMVTKRFANKKLYQVVSNPIKINYFFIGLTYHECKHGDQLFLIWDKRLRKVVL